jgi:ATP-dependent Lon protease
MSRLRLVPLDDAVIFPGMTVALSVEDAGSDTRVLLVPRQGTAFARVGVVAVVSDRV